MAQGIDRGMFPRSRIQLRADERLLEALKTAGGWRSAEDAASLIGSTRPAVASSLARLVFGGQLESEVVEVPGTARLWEHSRVYRARLVHGEVRRLETLLPGWLQPQAVVEFGRPVMVIGKAGLKSPEADDEDQDGMPNGPEKGAASTPE